MFIASLAACLILCILLAAGQPQGKSSRDDSAAEKLGWKLGTQAWTFRDRTAIEAIQTAEKLGLRYLEMYPGQDLGKDFPGVKVGPELSAEHRAELKRVLAAHHVKLMNFGVVNIKNNEAEARKLFEFARDMGIEAITCEPEKSAWDLVEKLAEEFKINAACHDHPKPTPYWHPDMVLEAIKGRSRRLGACADTGHWTRSELVPVECLKKLEGRVISLHFKDISPPGLRGTDRPWGTGDGNARGILEELHRQGFRGLICVEYESGSGAELEANVAKCIEWFDKTAADILAKSAGEPKPDGK